jgi:hypothetical protein
MTGTEGGEERYRPVDLLLRTVQLVASRYTNYATLKIKPCWQILEITITEIRRNTFSGFGGELFHSTETTFIISVHL